MREFELMALPYAPDALGPVISKETIGFHHGKHLQTYVDNLNKLLPGSEYEGMTQEERWLAKYNEVVEFIETSHRNPSRHHIE